MKPESEPLVVREVEESVITGLNIAKSTGLLHSDTSNEDISLIANEVMRHLPTAQPIGCNDSDVVEITYPKVIPTMRDLYAITFPKEGMLVKVEDVGEYKLYKLGCWNTYLGDEIISISNSYVCINKNRIHISSKLLADYGYYKVSPKVESIDEPKVVDQNLDKKVKDIAKLRGESLSHKLEPLRPPMGAKLTPELIANHLTAVFQERGAKAGIEEYKYVLKCINMLPHTTLSTPLKPNT